MTFQEYKERIIFYLEFLHVKNRYLEEILKYYDSVEGVIILLFRYNIKIQDIFKITIPCSGTKYSKHFWDQQTTLLKKAIESNLFETQNYWND